MKPVPPPQVASLARPSAAQRAAARSAPWSARWLLVAPHRLGFFAAALMLSLSALWWCAVLLARAMGLALPWQVATASAHALLMSMAFMPMFFTGFLFTAGPKWLDLPEVPARSLLPALLCMLTGWCGVLPGFHISSVVSATGLALVALGWSMVSWRFMALVRRSRAPERLHPTLVAMACAVGAVVLWVDVAALALRHDVLLRCAIQFGLWGFLAVQFAVVSHRMIPFFGASAVPVLDAWRPLWLLWVMVGMLWLQAMLAVVERIGWPMGPGFRWFQCAIEAPGALLLLWLTWRWGLVQSLKIRMLAMLHGGFLWLGVAIGLQALSHGLMALTGNELSLGLAPVHALTMGYLGATMFAMTTRVASGHGGRPVAADNPAWILYWVLQAAVLLRVIGALWPSGAAALTLAAVLAWSVATVGWSWRYGNGFGRPRPDARPG